MALYSHSQLSTYADCPFKYKLRYHDNIKRDIEGVEGFLGSRVHETLKKCYDDLRLTRVNSLSDLLAYYNKIWDENWNDSIIIVKQDLTAEHYRALGERLPKCGASDGEWNIWSQQWTKNVPGAHLLHNLAFCSVGQVTISSFIVIIVGAIISIKITD